MRTRVLVPLSLLLALAIGACSRPPDVIPGKAIGDVRAASGDVRATRGGAARVLAAGTPVSGDDVLDTGSDGRVTIDLRHNHERITLEPNQHLELAKSPAFGVFLLHYAALVLDNGALKWLLLVFLFVMPLASILTWMERRQSAMMQDRLGPNRANIGPIKLKGILHFVADALKMIFKEDFIPGNVHRGLFALAPILALAPVLIAFAIIPFGPTVYPHAATSVISSGVVALDPPNLADPIRLQIFQVDFGLIFYFAVLTLANYGGTLAGWASYNKWALLGGLRSSSQMMSYEVTMGLSLMGVFLITGSLEPGYIAATGWNTAYSPSNPLNWLWLPQLPALILFFTAAIAETKRAPFDIPEGEPEIIGYFVEYSGIRWGMFFLAEFIEIVFISTVITTVFFGGYQVPFLDSDGFRGFGGYLPLPHLAVVGLQLGAFGAKVVALCWFQLLIRWTLPRFRADQLMNLGWKTLLPASLAWTLITALGTLLI
jgi:NADH-quinone oxidoreductase subunit H